MNNNNKMCYKCVVFQTDALNGVEFLEAPLRRGKKPKKNQREKNCAETTKADNKRRAIPKLRQAFARVNVGFCPSRAERALLCQTSPLGATSAFAPLGRGLSGLFAAAVSLLVSSVLCLLVTASVTWKLLRHRMRWADTVRENQELETVHWRETTVDELAVLDSMTLLSRFSRRELLDAVFATKNSDLYLERLDGLFEVLEFMGVKLVDKDFEGLKIEPTLKAFDGYVHDARATATSLSVARLKEYLRGEDKDVPKVAQRREVATPDAPDSPTPAGRTRNPARKRQGGRSSGCFHWNFNVGHCTTAGGLSDAEHQRMHPHKCMRCGEAHKLIQCV